jgi:hypothetical protein
MIRRAKALAQGMNSAAVLTALLAVLAFPIRSSAKIRHHPPNPCPQGFCPAAPKSTKVEVAV